MLRLEALLAVMNGISLAAQGLMQLRFLSRFTGRPALWRHYVLCPLLLCCEDLAVRSLFPAAPDAFALLGAFLVLYLLGRLLRADPAAALSAALLAVCEGQLSFGIVNSLSALLLPYVAGTPALYALLLWAQVLSLLLLAGCLRLSAGWFSLTEGDAPFLWTLLPLGLLFAGQELYLLHMLYQQADTLPAPERHLPLLLLQMLGLAALFVGLYACRRAGEGFRARADLEAARQEVRAQRRYIAQARLRHQAAAALRHDMQNHLTVLAGLLKAGGTEQAQAYLQSLTAKAGEIQLSCRTGKLTVDILLEDKLSAAKAAGIETEVALAFPPDCKAEDLDLCVIIANALDNAIHACARLKGRRFLRISGEAQGDFFRLEVENTCADAPLPPEGTGLRNIRTSAEKYHGVMTAEQSGGRFRLNVLLNIR